MDMRSQRSRLYLWRGFYQLMTEEKQLFSKITINHICQVALVHRSTFYQHFSDKYALLDFGLGELFADYQNLADQDRTLAPFYWANHFFENSRAQLLLETQQKDQEFSQLLHVYSVEMMSASLLNYLKSLPKTDIPLSLQVDFLISTVFSLSHWQNKQKTPIPIAEMDAYYQKLINQSLFLPLVPNNVDTDD